MDTRDQIRITEELLEGVKELNGEYQEGWENNILEAENLLKHLKQVKNNDLLHSVSGCFSFAKYFKENYKFWRYTKDNKETYQSEISGKIMTEEEIFEHWKSNNR